MLAISVDDGVTTGLATGVVVELLSQENCPIAATLGAMMLSAVTVVKTPVEAVVAPMVAPLMVPDVIAVPVLRVLLVRVAVLVRSANT